MSERMTARPEGTSERVTARPKRIFEEMTMQPERISEGGEAAREDRGRQNSHAAWRI